MITACNCNTLGSDNLNCTSNDGVCSCKSGFTGEKCNLCAGGYQKEQSGECTIGNLIYMHSLLKRQKCSVCVPICAVKVSLRKFVC